MKGFATIDHVALINVEGTGMVRPMQPRSYISRPEIIAPSRGVLYFVKEFACTNKIPAAQPAVLKQQVSIQQAVLLQQPGPIHLHCGVQVGVPGTVSAIFSTVRDASANVIMISQASSEHSVCFAVKQAQGDQAVAALNAR